MRRSHYVVLAVIIISGLLSACTRNTEDELLKQRFEALKAEEQALANVQQTLQDPHGLEGPGSVSIFLSEDLLNSVMAGANNLVIPVSGIEGATVTIRSMRADFRVGLPRVNIDAVATKKGLDASLELVGVAELGIQVTDGRLQMNVHLDSLVPRVQWSFFDFKIGGFVRDLMQVKILEEIRNGGEINIPIVTEIPLSIPAKQTPVAFTGVKGLLVSPALSIVGKAEIMKVLTLPDGLHVYGKISAKGGAI